MPAHVLVLAKISVLNSVFDQLKEKIWVNLIHLSQKKTTSISTMGVLTKIYHKVQPPHQVSTPFHCSKADDFAVCCPFSLSLAPASQMMMMNMDLTAVWSVGFPFHF